MSKATRPAPPEQTYTEGALIRRDRVASALTNARAHLEQTRTRAESARAARAALDASATEEQIAKVRADVEVKEERHKLATKAVTDAERELSSAEAGIAAAETTDRQIEQHKRGVLPILALQAQIDTHAAEIARLQREQVEVFTREVVPRNTPWIRTLGVAFQAAPPGHYESVPDVVVRGSGGSWAVSLGPLADAEQDRNRAHAAAARANPSPTRPTAGMLTPDQQDRLRFVLDVRGIGTAGDLGLSIGVDQRALYELTGTGVRWSNADPVILGEIVSGLPRALSIAEAAAGRPFDPAAYAAQRRDWRPSIPGGRS